MKFAICNETYQGWSFEEACAYTAQAGYDGIEIAPFTLSASVLDISASVRAELRSTATKHGLEITGLHWLLVSPPGMSVTSSDITIRAKTSDYLVELVRLCWDLGGNTMVFGSPKQRLQEDRVPYSDTVDRYLESTLPALDLAAELGIVICLEPLPPPEANFLLTLDDARMLINRLNGHPAAMTIFDVKSALSENRPLPELIKQNMDIIRHVHANDGNRRGPGFGETDFVPVLSALKDAGYEGYVSVEVFDYTPDPQTIASESIKYLRKCAAT